MSEFYIRTKTGNYNVAQLQAEINESPLIVPSCLGITAKGNDLTLEFASALSTGSPSEETYLDSIIASHTPTPQTINTTQLPLSPIDNNKVAVHASYKPAIGVDTYSIWTGAGDDMTGSPATGELGGGELLHFNAEFGVPQVTKDVKFNPKHGRVWLHEGYLKIENGGIGDYITVDIKSEPTPLQTSSNLSLVVEDNWVKPASGSPSNATHGWADADKIALIPRTFKDGDWDYDGTNLIPNYQGTGQYKISDIEQTVHRLVNKIPCYGSCTTYFSMESKETIELPRNKFIRFFIVNNSNTNWSASMFMEIYRQRTVVT